MQNLKNQYIYIYFFWSCKTSTRETTKLHVALRTWEKGSVLTPGAPFQNLQLLLTCSLTHSSGGRLTHSLTHSPIPAILRLCDLGGICLISAI